MKNPIIQTGPAFLIILLCVVFSACTLSAQDIVKQNRALKEFTAIEVGGAFNVKLVQGDKHSVTVEANADVIENIRTKVVNSTLEINLENWKKNSKNKANITVTFKSLKAMEISGASNVTSSGSIKAGPMALEISGASNVNLDLRVSKLVSEISGASNVTLSGAASEQILEISGASNYKAADFSANQTIIEASGASKIKVNAAKSLIVEASGATNIHYSGEPDEVNVEASGASKVKKM